MTVPRVRLLHETNPEKYFPALYLLAQDGKVELTGANRYSVAKEWLRSWLRDRTDLRTRTVHAAYDLKFRLSQWWVRDEVLVIGFAPWDWRILIYRGLARRNRILYQTSWHDWRIKRTPRQFFAPLLQRFWRRFLHHPNVRVVAVTPVAARSVMAEMGVQAQVIPHSVPTVFFEAAKARQRRRSGPLRLLYVGEVSEKKGIKAVLDMMPTLSRRGITLTVVGTGPLMAAVEAAGPSVEYLGAIHDRSEIAKVMASHDLLVVLSRRTSTWEELFGIVIVEALAAGLAVLASDHVGPRSILEIVNGAGLYNEGDIEGVTKRILDLDADTKALEALQHKQRTASEPFEIHAVANAWLCEVERARS